MARLSSQYDKEVGKVLVIRGDEAYARTTDSRVKVMASDRTDFNNYRVGLLCNVYRDRGESKITLYNEDTVINQFDWSDNTEQMYIGMNNTHTAIDPDTCLELAWGVPHEIYIRYKGNNQCLPSKSKVLQIYEPLPDEFATNIAMTTTVDDTDVEVTVTIDINGVATVGTHDTDIEIYLDDELKDTINTGDSNVASTTIENISSGVHMITAIVVGSDKIHSATAYEEVIVGDKVEIIQYPKPFIIGANNTILVSVKRYNDEPIVGGNVTFDGETYITDNDGIATIVLSNIIGGYYYATYSGVNSNEVNIETYQPSIVIRADNGIVSRDKNDVLTVSLSNPLEGIPITLSKIYRESGSVISEETLHTNSEGIATKTITGGKYSELGTGLFTYNAQSYDSEVDSIDIDDVIYAYKNGVQWNSNALSVSQGTVTENINGLVIQGSTVNDFPLIRFTERGIMTYSSWILTFQVTADTSELKIDVGGDYRTIGVGGKTRASVELKFIGRHGMGTLSIYVNGVKTYEQSGNVIPELVMYPYGNPDQKRKALFYNIKFVRISNL